MAQNKKHALDFVDLLLRLAKPKKYSNFYICITLRSDYIGDCDAFYNLPEILRKTQYLVPRLTQIQKRKVIVGPLNLFNIAIDPVLVERILDESSNERDSLPVLQHALMRTYQEWSKTEKGPVSLESYQRIGTFNYALSICRGRQWQ